MYNIYIDGRGKICYRRNKMKIDKSLVTGSTTMLVLILLNDGDKYGYEMIKELEERSDNAFVLKEGTLYPLLHELENDAIVESYTGEAESGRKRKYYRITLKGQKLLSDKKKEWDFFASKINKVIGGEGYALA
jgi:PadR family transcriptional regulator, regulatory protein PadR